MSLSAGQAPADSLTFRPVNDVTYCDVEWLRTGFDVMEFDAQDGIVFMDELIPVATAQALNVPPLLSRMLHAQELDITGFGQSEPLTDRSVPGASPPPTPRASPPTIAYMHLVCNYRFTHQHIHVLVCQSITCILSVCDVSPLTRRLTFAVISPHEYVLEAFLSMSLVWADGRHSVSLHVYVRVDTSRVLACSLCVAG